MNRVIAAGSAKFVFPRVGYSIELLEECRKQEYEADRSQYDRSSTSRQTHDDDS